MQNKCWCNLPTWAHEVVIHSSIHPQFSHNFVTGSNDHTGANVVVDVTLVELEEGSITRHCAMSVMLAYAPVSVTTNNIKQRHQPRPHITHVT